MTAPARDADLDAPLTATAVVEIPKGSRNKYEYDPAAGRIRLDRRLFTATRYPGDYGFVPDTLAEDDDPLDVLILLEEATFPGCQVLVRPIGVFWMTDEHGPDAKILAVPANDHRWSAYRDISDVETSVLNEINHFFAVYKQLEAAKHVEIAGWEGRERAAEVLADARRRHERVREAATGQP